MSNRSSGQAIAALKMPEFDTPKYSENTENLVGDVTEIKENYDLLTAIMICLGHSGDDKYTGLLKLLDILLSPEKEPEEKKKILLEDFHIKMTKELYRNNLCILTCLFLRVHRSKSLDVAHYACVFWPVHSKKYPGTSYFPTVPKKLESEVSELCNLSQGIFEKGEARGEAKIIKNMYEKGFSLEQIAFAADKSIEEIKAVIEGKEPILV